MKVFLLFAMVLALPAGLVAQKVEWARMEALGEKVVKAQNLPGGSLHVMEKGEVVFEKGFGVVDAEGTRAWGTDEACYIASMSKSITATLVARLVDQEVLRFDDPISKWLPEYGTLKLRKGGGELRSPTIAECLSHTSGMPGGTMKKLAEDSVVRTGNQQEVAAFLAKEGLVAKPGTKYAYTFRGYAAVAACVEKATGRKFAVVLEEELTGPLGMKDTGFRADVALLRRMPMRAKQVEGKGDELLEAVVRRVAEKDMGFVNCAGAMISTPDDLMKFYRFHALGGTVGEKELISGEVLEKLYQPQPASADYGLGFGRHGGARVGHGGATGTLGVVDLKNDVVYLALTQAGGAPAKPLTQGGLKLMGEILKAGPSKARD